MRNTDAQVIFSSILTVRGKNSARNRCIMQIDFWLHGWCYLEDSGFNDDGTSFDDYSLLRRDGIHLSRSGQLGEVVSVVASFTPLHPTQE